MGLYVILEGTSFYNEDVQPNLTEEEFKNFDNMMNSNQAFDLSGESNTTPENIEKKVKDIEKKNGRVL